LIIRGFQANVRDCRDNIYTLWTPAAVVAVETQCIASLHRIS
jgi:hypothetical protein